MKMQSDDYKVLIVDDVDDNIIYIEAVLEIHGILSQTAKNGLLAIEMLQKDLPDLILLDVMMPEINGYETCKKIKQNVRTKNIPVIFLTAKKDTEDILMGFKVGAVDYLTKPVNAEELIHRVVIHVELKRSKEYIQQLNKNLEKRVEERTFELQKEIQEKIKTEISLKENEEKFRNIFNSTNDGILISDFNGNIIEANQAICLSFNYTKEELLKMNSMDITYDTTRKKQLTIRKRIINEKGLVFEIINITKDGKKIPCEVNSKIINFHGEKVILSVGRDITYRKQNEKKILRATIETEENERKRFARDLHDGIGAILSSINMYLNLLKGGDINENRKQSILNQTIELIELAVNSAREIANNIKPHLLSNHGLKASINFLCQKITKTGKIKIDNRYEVFILDIDEDFEIIIFRIISELINNTIKHAKANNISIKLTCDNSILSLFYSDDGVGFDVTEELNKENKGMGLQNIINRVKSIHGNCNIESSKNSGIKVKIDIKL